MHGAMSSQETQGADATDAVDAPGAVSREDNNDVALAQALAQTARTVEHVVDLGPGRHGVAMTYGPGKRVVGIVLRRFPQPAGSVAPPSVVEAHIVVSIAAVVPSAAPKTQSAQRKSANTRARGRSVTPETPVLLRIAGETRGALAATLRRLRPGERWEIDITIDDLRDTDDTDARVSSGAH